MKKKIISLVLTGIMTAGLLAGCAGNAAAPAADSAAPAAEAAAPAAEAAAPAADAAAPAADAGSGEKHYTFGYTCMDGTNPFFVTIEKEMRTLVEAKGDTLITTDPANDVTLQITQVEDMISQGIDAIFLNPAEAEGILPALDQLKEAGIPIINFDTEVADMSYVASYIGSDNYNAGKVCGEDLV